VEVGVRIEALDDWPRVGRDPEIAGIVGLGCLITFAVLMRWRFDFRLLTTIPPTPRPYLPAFLVCVLGIHDGGVTLVVCHGTRQGLLGLAVFQRSSPIAPPRSTEEPAFSRHSLI
jgi:hypothetical protein